MSFGYWDYFMSNLMLPVFGLAFILVPIFRLVMRLLEQYATGKRRVNWDGQAIVFFAAMVIVGVLLGKTLFTGGGIHLFMSGPRLL